MKYSRKQIDEALESWRFLLESFDKMPSVEELRNMSQDEFVEMFVDARIEKGKKPYEIEMWEAAQMDPVDKNDIGACEIIENPFHGDRNVKLYSLFGHYKNGTELNIQGSKKVLRWFAKFNEIRLQDKEWDDAENRLEHGQITNINGDPYIRDENGKIIRIKKADEYTAPEEIEIVKRANGYFIEDYNKTDDMIKTVEDPEHPGEMRTVHTYYSVGPFPKKSTAMKYVFQNKLHFHQKDKEEKDKVEVDDSAIHYPMYSFEYTMHGIECMDIVVGETKEKALKKFVTQWRRFSGMSIDPYMVVRNEKDAEFKANIRNLVVTQLNTDDEKREAIAIADEVKNPLTNNLLASDCRDKTRTYSLGANDKSYRIPITLSYESENECNEDDLQIELDESMNRLLF